MKDDFTRDTLQGDFKGDFTRDTFDPAHDFYRVLMQQGRVQIDADWNEQIAILLYRLETLIKDVFGEIDGHFDGGPTFGNGFKVVGGDPTVVNDPLRISIGHYYVGGLLCETRGKNHMPVQLEPPSPNQGERAPGAYLVYLDVYEKYVAAAQLPSIAEPALGGRDTAGRSKICWTVRFWPLPPGNPTDLAYFQKQRDPVLSELSDRDDHRGMLRARTKPLGYTGAQNQLYRVQIHQGGIGGADTKPTWKWSRENACVAFAATSFDSGNKVVDLRAGPGAAGAFSAGDWVEITRNVDRDNDKATPDLYRLYQVTFADPNGSSLTLNSLPNWKFDPNEHPIVRRWDQRSDADGEDLTPSGGCIPLVETRWCRLEHGIEICFDTSDNSTHYRSGDYWLIPARTATTAIEWLGGAGSADDVSAAPPWGVKHRYAALAGIAVSGEGKLQKPCDLRIIRDCLPPHVQR
jgi:hypothetical protein